MRPSICSCACIAAALAMALGIIRDRCRRAGPAVQPKLGPAPHEARLEKAMAPTWYSSPAATSPWAPTGTDPRSATRMSCSVDGFWIDRTEVTNAQFGKFVAATGYVTLAERGGDPKVHVNMPKELPGTGFGRLHHADRREQRRQRHTMVPIHLGGRLAAPRRTQHLNCWPRKSSGGSRRLRRCTGLRALAGT